MMSGGIVIAIAAVLWLIYLVPTWRRRSEYLATERNAVRLQQTMRILAETTELPGQVHLEISAREVAEKQKVLRKVQAEARERARAEALEEAAILRAELTARPPVAAQRSRGRKRARRTAAATMLMGVIALVWGVIILLGGGAPVLAIVGGLAAVGGVSAVTLLARPVRMVRVEPAPASAPAASQPLVDLADPLTPNIPQAAPLEPGWLPTELPQPLYNSQGSAAATAMARADAQDALRRAALAQVLAERAEQLSPPEPVTITPPQAPETRQGPPSRFAHMGVVDEYAEGGVETVDLIARRRNAG